MKKFGLVLAAVLFLSFSAFAQYATFPKFEFNIMGGYGLAQAKGNSSYYDEWSYQLLQYVHEDTVLDMKAENAVYFTGGLSYFFHPNFGIQLGAGYFSSKMPITGTFDFTYKWTVSSTVYNEGATWGGDPSDGKISTIPIFLNLVGKFRTSMIDIFVTAGPALYMNSLEANSYIGFGDTYFYSYYIYPYTYYSQWVDAFQVDATIPKTSWTAFGGNFGLGFDIKVAPSVAITAEARYFLIPKKSLTWEWMPGAYDSIFYENFTGWEYTADDFADYQAKMTTLEVNPSFFSVAIGLRINFGAK